MSTDPNRALVEALEKVLHPRNDPKPPPGMEEYSVIRSALLAEVIAALSNPQEEAGGGEGGQDRKFKFENGRFVNRVSGEAIPDDEPVILFRARDRHALSVLDHYLGLAADPRHRQAIGDRIAEFSAFREAHPERLKEPGITGHIRLNSELPTQPDEREAVATLRISDQEVAALIRQLADLDPVNEPNTTKQIGKEASALLSAVRAEGEQERERLAAEVERLIAITGTGVLQYAAQCDEKVRAAETEALAWKSDCASEVIKRRAAEAELSQWRSDNPPDYAGLREANERLRASQAEVAKLREGLKKIENGAYGQGFTVRKIARAALDTSSKGEG